MLNAEPITIDVFLYDIFNTVVQGSLLQDKHIYVSLNVTDTNAVTTSSLIQRVNSSIGMLIGICVCLGKST